MKSFSIIAIALIAFIGSTTAVPLLNQPADATELQARLDIYNDFLAGLFSGLVQTTFGSVSNFLNQLITENPLGVGKRDLEQSRIDIFTFLYDNILQDFFSGIVGNTFGHLSSTLNNLIQTNPLGLGKRETQDDLVARVDALSFLYDNVLAELFSGLVSNTFGHLGSTLLNLIQTNPLGVGKRDLEQSRIDIFTFLYDNILQDFFSGIVGNTFGHLSSTLTNLIQTNPLGLGKRSIDLQQIQVLLAPYALTLVQKLKSLAHQIVAVWNDQTKLSQLLLGAVAEIKATFTKLAQQLSGIIPATLVNEVSHVLAAVQSMLVFWTSGLAGSLGPVIGPFHL